jgi:hypothetical protein
MGSILVLAVEVLAQSYQGSPGGHAWYQHPNVQPGTPGPTEYLMPDGGRWVQYGNVMPGAAPPPVYLPPDPPREYIIHNYHHGYGPHDHSRFHRHD